MAYRPAAAADVARRILVGAQVAASCVLLIVAGLLVRATQHVMYTDPGFGYERAVWIDAGLAQPRLHTNRSANVLE